LRYRGVVFPV